MTPERRLVKRYLESFKPDDPRGWELVETCRRSLAAAELNATHGDDAARKLSEDRFQRDLRLLEEWITQAMGEERKP